MRIILILFITLDLFSLVVEEQKHPRVLMKPIYIVERPNNHPTLLIRDLFLNGETYAQGSHVRTPIHCNLSQPRTVCNFQGRRRKWARNDVHSNCSTIEPKFFGASSWEFVKVYRIKRRLKRWCTNKFSRVPNFFSPTLVSVFTNTDRDFHVCKLDRKWYRRSLPSLLLLYSYFHRFLSLSLAIK